MGARPLKIVGYGEIQSLTSCWNGGIPTLASVAVFLAAISFQQGVSY